MNTDGIDIWGSNVHIHDTYVNNADDCICVKGGVDGSYVFSENWLVENSTASGEGLSTPASAGTRSGPSESKSAAQFIGLPLAMVSGVRKSSIGCFDFARLEFCTGRLSIVSVRSQNRRSYGIALGEGQI